MPRVAQNAIDVTTHALNEQLRRADFLLCASDKQRDFWLGQLAGQGRINPAVYDEDANLDNLLVRGAVRHRRRPARADAGTASRAPSPGSARTTR